MTEPENCLDSLILSNAPVVIANCNSTPAEEPVTSYTYPNSSMVLPITAVLFSASPSSV